MFNLTGKINLLTPNLKAVSGKIRSELNRVKGSVKVDIKTGAAKNVKDLNRNIKLLNANLRKTKVLSRDAASAMTTLGNAWKVAATNTANAGNAAKKNVSTQQKSIETNKKLITTTSELTTSVNKATNAIIAKTQASKNSSVNAYLNAKAMREEALMAERLASAANKLAVQRLRASSVASPGTPYGGTAAGVVIPPSIYTGGIPKGRQAGESKAMASRAKMVGVYGNIATEAQRAATAEAKFATASEQSARASQMASVRAYTQAGALNAEKLAAEQAAAAQQKLAKSRLPTAKVGTPYGGTAAGRVTPNPQVYMGGGGAKGGYNAASKLTPELKKMAIAMRGVGRQTKQASSFMYEFGKSGALALKRFGAFTVATTIVFGFIYAVTDAVREAIKFQAELIKIGQVAAGLRDRLGSVSKQISDLSVNFAVSSSELVTVARTLTQAGLRGRDFTKALEAIAKSDLAPTFTDITNTTEGLIAAFNQFGLTSNDFEKSLSSINAVSGQFAVESDDIIKAIRKTGGVFASASKGVSEGTDALNEFIAVFTSVRATTRESADSIATGLRTIFTRLQRPRTIDLLEDYGIKLRDVEGNFVGVYKAVDILGENLQNLDQRSQRFFQIAQALGGFRQVGKTLPLLTQFEKRQEALNVAIGGTDSLSKDATQAMEGLGRQIKSVSEDFKAMIREVVGTSTFKNMTKSILALANTFIQLGRAIKPLIPLIAALVTYKLGTGLVNFTKGARAQLELGGATSATNRVGFGTTSGRYTSSGFAARTAGLAVFGGQNPRAFRARTRVASFARRAPGAIGRQATGIPGFIAGSYLSSREDKPSQIAGGALTGAFLGNAVGGPIGAAVGAIALGGKEIVDAFNADKIAEASNNLVDIFNQTSKAVEKYQEAETDTEKKKTLPDLRSRSKRIQKELTDLGAFQTLKPNKFSEILGDFSAALTEDAFTPEQNRVVAKERAKTYQNIFTRGVFGGNREQFNKEQRQKLEQNIESIVDTFDTDKLRKDLLDIGIDKLVTRNDSGAVTGFTKLGQDLEGLIQPAIFGQGTIQRDVGLLTQYSTAKNPDSVLASLLASGLEKAKREIKTETKKTLDPFVEKIRDFSVALKSAGQALDIVISKNQQLTNFTSQLFSNIGSPATIASRQRDNVFNNVTAFSGRRVSGELNRLGVGNSFLSRMILGGRQLEEQTPGLIQQVRRRYANRGATDPIAVLRKEFGDEGIFKDIPKELRKIIRDKITSEFRGDNSKTLDELISSGDLANFISDTLGKTYEESIQIAAKLQEESNRLSQREIELLNARVEAQSEINKRSFEFLGQRQTLSTRRASLFGNTIGIGSSFRQRRERLDAAGGRNVGSIANTLLGSGGLLQQRVQMERGGITNPEKAEELANSINKNIFALEQLSKDINVLADIEKELAQIQQKREQSRGFISELSTSGFSESFSRRAGSRALIDLQKGKSLNRFETERATGALNFFSQNAQTDRERQIIDRLSSRLAKQQIQQVNPEEIQQFDAIFGRGAFGRRAQLATSTRGSLTNEQKLAQSFDNIAKSSLAASKALNDIANFNVKNAFDFSEQEIKVANQRIQRIGNRLPGYQEGGMTSPGGARPAILHGGELVIPRDAVQKGMGGVLGFASQHINKKNKGLSFQDGGYVSIEDIAEDLYGLNKKKVERDKYGIAIESKAYRPPTQTPKRRGIQGRSLSEQLDPSLRDYAKPYSKRAQDEKAGIRRGIMSGFQARAATPTSNINFASTIDFGKAPVVQAAAEEAFAKDKSRIYFGSTLLEESDKMRNRMIESGQMRATPQDIERRQREASQAQTKKRMARLEKLNADLSRMKMLNREARSLLGTVDLERFRYYKDDPRYPEANQAIEALEMIRLGLRAPGDSSNLPALYKRANYIQDGVEKYAQFASLIAKKRGVKFDMKMGAREDFDLSSKPQMQIPNPSATQRKANLITNAITSFKDKFPIYGPQTNNNTRESESYQERLNKAQSLLDSPEFVIIPIDEYYSILDKAANHLRQRGTIGNIDSYTDMFKAILASNSPVANDYKKQFKEIGLKIPGFATGSQLIQQGGLANLHRGEAVIPAKASPDSSNFKELAANMAVLSREVQKTIGVFSGVAQKENRGSGGELISSLDAAINRASEVFNSIKIPETVEHKITGSVDVNFQGNDALTQKIAQQISKNITETVRQQIGNVISPVDGEILVG